MCVLLLATLPPLQPPPPLHTHPPLCTLGALEHAGVAVKYRTLFNLMFQLLAGFLVSLSVNYKVATPITFIFFPLHAFPLSLPPSLLLRYIPRVSLPARSAVDTCAVRLAR